MNVGRALSLVALGFLVGCSPSSYELRVRDPGAVRVDVAGGPVRGGHVDVDVHEDDVAGTLACPRVDGVELPPCTEGPVTGQRAAFVSQVPHAYAAERTASGGMDVVFRDGALTRRMQLFDGDGTLRLSRAPLIGSPRAFPAFQLDSMRTRGDRVDVAFVDALHQSARAPYAYALRVRTPVANVERVTQTVERPKGVAVLGFVAAGALIAGAAMAWSEGNSDGVRFGVALPLFALGGATAAFSTHYLTLPEREHRVLPPRSLAERVPY